MLTIIFHLSEQVNVEICLTVQWVFCLTTKVEESLILFLQSDSIFLSYNPEHLHPRYH